MIDNFVRCDQYLIRDIDFFETATSHNRFMISSISDKSLSFFEFVDHHQHTEIINSFLRILDQNQPSLMKNQIRPVVIQHSHKSDCRQNFCDTMQ
jgi:hypothetical protein